MSPVGLVPSGKNHGVVRNERKRILNKFEIANKYKTILLFFKIFNQSNSIIDYFRFYCMIITALPYCKMNTVDNLCNT